MTRHYLLLLFAVINCSTAVIFIKASEWPPLLLASTRSFLGALILLPLFVGALQKLPRQDWKPALQRSVMPGVLFAGHMMLWIVAARKTPAANGGLIVNLAPLAMPLMLHLTIKERVTRNEWISTLVAIAGVLLVGAGDFNMNPEYLPGDLLALASMLGLCGYLIAGRRNRELPSLWLYMPPLYLVSGLVCLLCALLFERIMPPLDGHQIGLVLCLGIFPTALGHSGLNRALRHVGSQLVSLSNLGQVFFASIWAYLFLAEVPSRAFWPSVVIIALGICYGVWSDSRERPPAT